jgi:DNA polymerase III alpha subunit
MKIDQVGQIVYNQDDLCDLLMQGSNLSTLNGVLVDTTVDLETAATILEDIPMFIKYNELAVTSVEEFDHRCQNTWHMPQKYKDLDIAEHVLSLCASDSELQRCGAELLLFQERDLFNLLRYLVYLVDIMQENNLIWGVGRGSSVASYVLYKLGVHRIDSLFYDLDPGEFLR